MVPGRRFPHERGRSSTGRSACPAQPGVSGFDPTISVGGGKRPCRPAPFPPTPPGRPKRPGSACPSRGLALRAARGRLCPLSVAVEMVPGNRSQMSGAALPTEDRLIPLSPASEKNGAGSAVGCVLARTARSPKATGQRLPLRGAGASRHPGQALPSVRREAKVTGRGSHVNRAVLPSEDRLFALSPALGKGPAPPQSAGASDPAATVRPHPHRPVAQSDRAAPAPAGGWRFAPSGAGAALCCMR